MDSKFKNYLSDLSLCYSSNCCFLMPDIWLPAGPLFTPHFSLLTASLCTSRYSPNLPVRKIAIQGKTLFLLPLLVQVVYAWQRQGNIPNTNTRVLVRDQHRLSDTVMQ